MDDFACRWSPKTSCTATRQIAIDKIDRRNIFLANLKIKSRKINMDVKYVFNMFENQGIKQSQLIDYRISKH